MDEEAETVIVGSDTRIRLRQAVDEKREQERRETKILSESDALDMFSESKGYSLPRDSDEIAAHLGQPRGSVNSAERRSRGGPSKPGRGRSLARTLWVIGILAAATAVVVLFLLYGK